MEKREISKEERTTEVEKELLLIQEAIRNAIGVKKPLKSIRFVKKMAALVKK